MALLSVLVSESPRQRLAVSIAASAQRWHLGARATQAVALPSLRDSEFPRQRQAVSIAASAQGWQPGVRTRQ